MIGLIVVTAAAWMAIAWGLRADDVEGPDRAGYEGRGGTARWEGAEIALPDLRDEARCAATAAQVLRLRGQPWTSAIALLGDPELRHPAGPAAWPSAVRLAHPEAGQWPVAHVAARRGADGRISAVALIGSLGRVLESDPGEPGYEAERPDPSRRSDMP
ncbi:MAG: hypothetical protein J0M02_09480 [Planctomycetes bacterium]|nr:hypothetical protein [Planctomycetota bacterium]